MARAITAIALGTSVLALPAQPAFADSIRAKQWHLTNLDISAAHKISEGSGVTVALIDTGVAEHRDLTGAVLTGTSVFPGQTGDGRKDIDGHGTEMAGIIAGRGHGSDDGVLGIAPAAKILPIRTPIQTGSNGTYISAAVDYAIAHHAKVINMSFGMQDDDALHQAIQKAQSADIVIVASAGNRSDESVPFPGKYPEVLTVGAYGKDGQVASFSVTGPQVDIAAPGEQILTTGNDDGYHETDGTSGAAAVVSGAAALLRAKYPDLSAAEIVHRLTATATHTGTAGRNDSYGYGRLNILKALTGEVKPVQTSVSSSASQADRPTAASQTSSGSGNSSVILGVVVLAAVLVAALVLIGARYARGGRAGS